MTNGLLRPEYLAGFFDGEGSVYTNLHSKQLPSLRVCISNTHLEVLNKHKSQYGGYISARRSKGERWRPQHQWVAVTGVARKFLSDIVPFLVIKRDVVLVAIEYLDHVAKPARERMDYTRTVYHHGRHWIAARNTEAHIVKAVNLVKRIRELNSGGFNARRSIPVEYDPSTRNRCRAIDERTASPATDSVGV